VYCDAGETATNHQVHAPHQGGHGLLAPPNALLRKKDNSKQDASRDEKTASIRSYPKRLSPTVLPDEMHSNITGILRIVVLLLILVVIVVVVVVVVVVAAAAAAVAAAV